MVAEFRGAVRRQATYVMEDARDVAHALDTALILKTLEQIGDYARSIAEHAVYMVEGGDFRHDRSRTESDYQR